MKNLILAKVFMINNKKYAVPALDKGFDILELLVMTERPLNKLEIAQALERTPNELYRVLIGLEARGYLIRDDAGKYRVSLKLYNLSRRIDPLDKIRQCAIPHMEDLAVTIGHSCHLSMLYQSQTMVIVNARSHEPLSLNIAEGAIFPTTQSISGWVLLANSNDEVRHMILERDAESQHTIPDDLSQQLSRIQQQGWHQGQVHQASGVLDISALIGQKEGLVIAALGVSILQGMEHSPWTKEAICDELISKAQLITHQLGC